MTAPTPVHDIDSQNPAESQVLRRLGVQVGAAPLIVAGMACAAILAYFFTAVGEYRGHQDVHWALQRAQVLNQRYVKEVLLNGQGYRTQIDKTAGELRQTLDALARGGAISEEDGTAVSVPAITSPVLRKRIIDAQTHADSLLTEGNVFSQSLKTEDSKSRLFEDLYRKSLDLQSAADHLVDTLDRHLESSSSWWQVDSVAVELAERQRMAIQQYVKEILFVAHGIPADYQSSRNKIQDTLRILKVGGYIEIEPGQSIRIPAQGSADLQEALKYFDESFNSFSASSNQFLMMNNASVERTLQLKRLSDAGALLQQDLTWINQSLRTQTQSRLNTSTGYSIICLILILLMGVGGAFLWTEHRAGRPIRTLAGLLAAPSTTSAQRKRFLQPLMGNSAEIDSLAEAAESRAAAEDECAGLLGLADSHTRSQTQIPLVRSSDFGRFPIVAAAHRLLESLRGNTLNDSKVNTDGDELPLLGRPTSKGPRWQMPPDVAAAAAAAGEEITIVGRTPAESTPLVPEAEIFEQLLRRASELQEQQAQLMLINAELQEKTRRISIADAEPDPDGSRDIQIDPDRNFEQKQSELLQDQREELRRLNERLQDQAEIIRRTEDFMKHQKVELSSINRLLVEQTDRQSQEIHRLTQLLQDKTQALLMSQKQLDLLSADLISGNSNLAVLQTEITQRERKISQQTAEIDRISSLLQERELEIRSLCDQLETAAKADDVQTQNSNSTLIELQRLTDDLQIREQAIRGLEQRLDDYEAAEARLREQNHDQSNEINRLSAELTNLVRSIEERARIEESIQETMDRLRSEVTDKEIHIQNLEHRTEHLQNNVRDLEQAQQDRLNQLNNALRDLEAELGGARFALADKDRLVEELTQERAKQQAAYDSIFTARQELAARLADLESEKQTTTAEHKQMIEELAQAKQAAESLKSEIDAMIHDRLAIEMRLTLSEENFKHQSDRAAQLLQSLARAEQDIHRLTADLATSRKAHEAWSQKWIELESRYESEKSSANNLRESVDDLRRKIAELESQLNAETLMRLQSEDKAGELNQRASEIQLQKEQLAQQVRGLAAELTQLREMNEKLVNENQHIAADLVRQIGILRGKDAEIISAQSKIQETQSQLTIRGEEFKAKSAQLDALQREITLISQQYQTTVLELAKIREENQRHSALAAALEQKLSAAREALRTSLDEISTHPSKGMPAYGKLL